MIVGDASAELEAGEAMIGSTEVGSRKLSMPDDEHDLLSINYTSGTTSRPRGVMYTHRGAYLQALAVIAETGLSSRSVYLWTLPMFHCNGWAFVWAVPATGARSVFVETFDPDRAWTSLADEAVTHFCGAPTVLTMLAESSARRALSSRVLVFLGGAPPSPALLDRLGSLSLDVVHLYGLTETYGPVCVCVRQREWEDLPVGQQARLQARQGVPNLVSEPIRVVDPELSDVPADGETMGEVVMRGNNVTIGYFRDPEATAAAFSDGWFHTGDLGVMHPDGYIELRDRKKDVIISGGENISTIEVEQALLAHPDVVDAAVVGIADERWGEVPKAFLVTRGGRTLTLPEVQQWTRESLAGYKLPRALELLSELPKTATGKVRKVELRAMRQSVASEAKTADDLKGQEAPRG
jgi:fatty-acyl-CoA synthase